MEFEIDNRTPKDRIDPEFLNRMMECDYGEPVKNTFGNIPYIRPSDVTPVCISDTCRGASQGQQNNSAQNQTQGQYQGNGLWGKPLAMVYAPIQIFRNIYDPEDALAHGTIFKELDFPWYPTPCSSGNMGNTRKDGMRRG